MLFSVSATMKSKDEYQQDFQTIKDDLENWRHSIPSNFRPGERFVRAYFTSSASVMAALRTHLIYHNFVMVLSRLSLQVVGISSSGLLLHARENFMSSARRVIELTGHLEVEPYAPSLCVFISRHFLRIAFSDPKQTLDRDSVVRIPQPLPPGNRKSEAF